MRKLNFLVILILIIFPFGQLTKLPLGIPEVNIYLQDLVILILVLGWLFHHLFTKKPFPNPPLTVPILSFFLVAAFSLMVNLSWLTPREVLVASLYLWRWIFYVGVYFVVFDLKPRFIKQGLISVGFLSSLFGLAQYFLYPDFRNLIYLGWDPHYHRLVGTFFDPGFIGIILVLTLILLVVSNWEKIISLKLKNLPVYCLLFIVYSSLALTYSRSSYLAYLVGMGTIAWLKRKPKFFLTIFLIGVLSILALPRFSGGEGVRLERTTTIQSRFGSWRQAIVIFRHQPILGVGFNAYRYAQRNYGFLAEENWQASHAGAGADSSFLFVLATTGIVGLLTYFWFWWSVIRLTFKTNNAEVGLVILASTTALFCHSFFLNSLFYPWILAWLGIILGLR